MLIKKKLSVTSQNSSTSTKTDISRRSSNTPLDSAANKKKESKSSTTQTHLTPVQKNKTLYELGFISTNRYRQLTGNVPNQSMMKRRVENMLQNDRDIDRRGMEAKSLRRSTRKPPESKYIIFPTQEDKAPAKAPEPPATQTPLSEEKQKATDMAADVLCSHFQPKKV